MNRITSFFFNTLRGRLILSVAIIHAVMMSIFVFDLTVRQKKLILNHQEDDAVEMAKILSTSSAIWISASDVVGLQEMVDNQLNYSELEFVIFTDETGLILAHTDKSKKGKYIVDFPKVVNEVVISKNPELVDVVCPVILEQKHIGWVRLGINQKTANDELSSITFSGIIYMIIAIFVGAIIALFMGHRITRRLYVIKDTIVDISEGNKLSRANLTGKDEAAFLAHEFDKMLDTLSENEKQLTQTNEILIEKNQEYSTLNEEYLSQNESLAEMYIEKENIIEKLNVAQKIAKTGHWELDIKNNILSWSDEIYRIFDLKPQEFEATYDAFLNNIHPEDRDLVNGAYLNSLKTKTPYEIEHRLLLKDGSIKYVLEKCNTEYDFNGNAINSIGTVQDITEKKMLEQKVAELNSRYNVAFNTNTDAIAILDIEGGFIEVNQSFMQFTGFTKNEIFDKNNVYVKNWLGTDKQQKFDELFNKFGKVENFEIDWINNLDEHKYGLMTVQMVQINEKPHILSITKDITSIKLSEQKIKAIEEKYKIAFNSSFDCTAINSFDGIFIDINEAFTKITGYTKQDIIGKTTLDLELWSNINDRAKIQKEVREKGLCENLIAEFKCKDGSIKIGDINSRIILMEEKPFLLTVIRDITEKKKMEENLFESHQLLEGVFNAMPVRVFWKDKNLNYLGCNTTFAKDAGFKNPEEIIGKNDYEMGWKSQAETYRNDDLHVINTKTPKLNIEEPQTSPDGNIITLLTSKVPLLNSKGETTGVLGIYVDISERKTNEELLKKSFERNRALLESSPDLIFVNDKDGNYLDFHASNETLLYTSPSMFLNKNVKDIMPDDLGKQFMKCFEKSLQTKELQVLEYKLLIAEKLFYFDARIILFDNDKFMTIVRDVTEQKKLEYEKIKLSKIVEDSFNEIYIINTRTLRFEYANQGALNNLGYTLEELTQMTPVQVDPDFTIESLKELGSPLFYQQKESIVFESKHVRKDKTEYPIEIHLQMFKDKGEILFVAIVNDISKRKQAEKEIKKLSVAVEQSANGIVITDFDGNITYVNRRFTEITGYSYEEAMGENPRILKSEAQSTEYYSKMWHAIKSGKIWSGEFYNKKKSGEFYWEQTTITPLKNDSGEITSFLAIKEDITARKNTEIALAESEKKYRTFINSSPISIFSTNEKGEFIYANTNFKNLTGYTDFELTKMNLLNIIAKKEQKRGVLYFELLRKRGISINKEATFMSKSGKEIQFILNSIKIDEHTFIAFCNDITDKKIVDKALIESEQKYRIISDKITDVVWLMDLDGRSMYVSPSIEQFTGFTVDEYLNQKIENRFTKDSVKYGMGIFQTELQKYRNNPDLLKNYFQKMEMEYICKDGNTKWGELIITPFFDKDNKLVGIHGVTRDITERKNSEKVRINSIIETEEKERHRFSQEIHDGVGPILSIIKLYLQWIGKPDSKADKTQLFKKIEELVENVNQNLREISNKLSPHTLTNLGLTPALKAFIERVSFTTKMNIKFVSNVEEKLSTNSEFAVYRILTECLNNTIKHAKANNIAISLKHQNNRLHIDYKDDGIGFDLQKMIAKEGSNGLKNIENRLKSVSAKYKIISNEGKGFEIKIVLPV